MSITEFFFPDLASAYSRRRMDSAFSEDIQEQIKGIESDIDGLQMRKDSTGSPKTAQVTFTFHPSNGSTCLSLYPRTKTFTYHSPISSTTCLASTEEGLWKITATGVQTASPSNITADNSRFTIESADGSVSEAYKNCRVKILDTGLVGTGSPMSPSRESRFWMRPNGARRPSMVVH